MSSQKNSNLSRSQDINFGELCFVLAVAVVVVVAAAVAVVAVVAVVAFAVVAAVGPGRHR